MNDNKAISSDWVSGKTLSQYQRVHSFYTSNDVGVSPVNNPKDKTSAARAISHNNYINNTRSKAAQIKEGQTRLARRMMGVDIMLKQLGRKDHLQHEEWKDPVEFAPRQLSEADNSNGLFDKISDTKISGSIESFTMKENHSQKMEITIPKSVIDYKDMSEEQFKTVFNYKLELKQIQAQWISSDAKYAVIIQSQDDFGINKSTNMPMITRLKVSVYDFEGLALTCFSQFNFPKQVHDLNLTIPNDVIVTQGSSTLTLSDTHKHLAYFNHNCDAIYYCELPDGFSDLLNPSFKLQQSLKPISTPVTIPDHLLLTALNIMPVSRKLELLYDSVIENSSTIYSLQLDQLSQQEDQIIQINQNQVDLIEKDRLEDTLKTMVAWGPGLPGAVTTHDTPTHKQSVVARTGSLNGKWQKQQRVRLYQVGTNESGTVVVYTKIDDQGLEFIEAVKDSETEKEISIDKNGEFLGVSPSKDGLAFLFKSAKGHELKVFSYKNGQYNLNSKEEILKTDKSSLIQKQRLIKINNGFLYLIPADRIKYSSNDKHGQLQLSLYSSIDEEIVSTYNLGIEETYEIKQLGSSPIIFLSFSHTMLNLQPNKLLSIIDSGAAELEKYSESFSSSHLQNMLNSSLKLHKISGEAQPLDYLPLINVYIYRSSDSQKTYLLQLNESILQTFSSHRYLCSCVVKSSTGDLVEARDFEHRILFISNERDEILLFKISKQQITQAYTYKPKRQSIETLFLNTNGSNLLIKIKDQDDCESLKIGKEGFEYQETFKFFETLSLKRTSNILSAFHNTITLADPDLQAINTQLIHSYIESHLREVDLYDYIKLSNTVSYLDWYLIFKSNKIYFLNKRTLDCQAVIKLEINIDEIIPGAHEECFREDLYVISGGHTYKLKIIKDERGYVPRNLLFQDRVVAYLDFNSQKIWYFDKLSHSSNLKNALSFIQLRSHFNQEKDSNQLADIQRLSKLIHSIERDAPIQIFDYSLITRTDFFVSMKSIIRQGELFTAIKKKFEIIGKHDVPFLTPCISKKQCGSSSNEFDYTSFDDIVKGENIEMRALIHLLYEEMINVDHTGLLYGDVIDRNLLILNRKDVDIKPFLLSPMAFHFISPEYYPQYGVPIPFKKRILQSQDSNLKDLLINYNSNVQEVAQPKGKQSRICCRNRVKTPECFGNQKQPLHLMEYSVVNLKHQLRGVNSLKFLLAIQERAWYDISILEVESLQTLIQYKFSKFAWWTFFLRFLLMVVFCVSYITDIYYFRVSDDDDSIQQSFITNRALCSVILLYFMIHEIRKCIKRGNYLDYFTKVNYINEILLYGSYISYVVVSFVIPDCLDAIKGIQLAITVFGFTKLAFLMRLYNQFSFLVQMTLGAFRDVLGFIMFFACVLGALAVGINIVVDGEVTSEYDGVRAVAFYFLAVKQSILDTDPDSLLGGSDYKIHAWVMWFITLLVGNIVFFNFIMAVIWSNYEKCMEKLVAQGYWGKLDMIIDIELFMSDKDRADPEYFPSYLIHCQDLDDNIEGHQGLEWQGFVREIKRQLEFMRNSLKKEFTLLLQESNTKIKENADNQTQDIQRQISLSNQKMDQILALMKR